MAYGPGKLIGVVEKNRVQEMRVRLVELRGETFVDLRVFAAAGDGERRPTKRGMAFKPDLLPEMIGFLIEATREFVRTERDALRATQREANAAGPLPEQAQGATVSTEAPVAGMAGAS